MKKHYVLSLAMSLAINCYFLPSYLFSAPITPAELPDLVEKVLPGVVNISSSTVQSLQVPGMEDFLRYWGIPRERRSSSMGSGLLLDKDGYILTNNHVIAGATEVVVTLEDKRQFNARLVGSDEKLDLALLRIRESKLITLKKIPTNLVPLNLGNSDNVRIAEPVFAVGNPFGLAHTVTMGIISAKNRTIGLGPFDNFLQTDASINPGNSGGPLFNLKGEVIGINTVIFSRTQQSAGLGFAIPINAAKIIIPDLKKYGRVPRPWLGVISEQITESMAHYYGLPVEKGVLVLNVVQNAPADDAGLARGDIITSIGSTTIEDPYQVDRELAKLGPKGTTEITFQRGKKKITKKLKLSELPPIKNLPEGIL